MQKPLIYFLCSTLSVEYMTLADSDCVPTTKFDSNWGGGGGVGHFVVGTTQNYYFFGAAPYESFGYAYLMMATVTRHFGFGHPWPVPGVFL